MITTAREALALVRRHQVVTMTPSEGFHSLVAEVAGGPVRGSWWGHPQGHRMFDLANVLHDSAEIVAAKLVEGRITFIHRSLWPALYRVVSDAGLRARRWDPLEKKILAEVERAGEVETEPLIVRWDADRKRFKKAVDRLAQGMALLSANVHTEKGSHATVLRSWERWATPALRREAKQLPFDEALETLRAACGGNLFGLSLR